MFSPHDHLISRADEDPRSSTQLPGDLRVDEEIGELARSALEASRLHAISGAPRAQLVAGIGRHERSGSMGAMEIDRVVAADHAGARQVDAVLARDVAQYEVVDRFEVHGVVADA